MTYPLSLLFFFFIYFWDLWYCCWRIRSKAPNRTGTSRLPPSNCTSARDSGRRLVPPRHKHGVGAALVSYRCSILSRLRLSPATVFHTKSIYSFERRHAASCRRRHVNEIIEMNFHTCPSLLGLLLKGVPVPRPFDGHLAVLSLHAHNVRAQVGTVGKDSVESILLFEGIAPIAHTRIASQSK